MKAAREALALVALLSVACAHNLPPPKASSLELTGAPVVWRDWSAQGRGAICEAEPQFLLDELTLVNSALQRFLALGAGRARGLARVAHRERGGRGARSPGGPSRSRCARWASASGGRQRRTTSPR